MVLPCRAPTLEPPGGSRWVYVSACACWGRRQSRADSTPLHTHLYGEVMSGVCIIHGLLGHGMSSPPTGCTQLLMKPLPCRPSSGRSLPPKTEAGLSAGPVGRGGAELWSSDRCVIKRYMCRTAAQLLRLQHQLRSLSLWSPCPPILTSFPFPTCHLASPIPICACIS